MKILYNSNRLMISELIYYNFYNFVYYDKIEQLEIKLKEATYV